MIPGKPQLPVPSVGDREFIVRWLKRLERRIRIKRLSGNLARGLSFFIFFLFCLKTFDLFRPVPGRMIICFSMIWSAAVAGYAVWRWFREEGLAQVAAQIDRKACLQDEMKSAYWFITSAEAGRQSAVWIEAQLRRAAKRAQQIDLDQVCPRSVPGMSYAGVTVLILLICLNFVPLPRNHNWLYLQASPIAALNAKEDSLYHEARQLLNRADWNGNSELARRLEEVVRNLETGEMTMLEALHQLRDIDNALDAGRLDLGTLDKAINELVRSLEATDQMQEVAAALEDRNLQEAGERMNEVARRVSSMTADQLGAILPGVRQAASKELTGLQNVMKDLRAASDALEHQDKEKLRMALERISWDLRTLDDKIRAQQSADLADEQLRRLEIELHHRDKDGGQGQDADSLDDGVKGQAKQGQADSAQQEATGGPSKGMDGTPDSARTQTDSLMPSGISHAPLQVQGESTRLDVQLKSELVSGRPESGTKQDKREDPSRAERSSLEYRNVRSEPTVVQKDLLHEDSVPREYRNLVKSYFEELRQQDRR